MDAKEWADKYRIGVLEIDEQHALLFQLLSDFEQASIEKTSSDLSAEVLQRLISYVKFHFRAEEKLMAKIKFPELDEHVTMHRNFEGKVVEFILETEQKQNDISSALIQFLKEWLINHILAEDIKISRFLGDSTKS